MLGVAVGEREEPPDPGFTVRPEQAVEAEDEGRPRWAEKAQGRQLLGGDLGRARLHRAAGQLTGLDPGCDAEPQLRPALRNGRDRAGASARGPRPGSREGDDAQRDDPRHDPCPPPRHRGDATPATWPLRRLGARRIAPQWPPTSPGSPHPNTPSARTSPG